MGYFFFNDTATTEIYTLSLHDALPILCTMFSRILLLLFPLLPYSNAIRSEEHTSELQSRQYLVCRLLLEKNDITIRPALWTAPRGRAEPSAEGALWCGSPQPAAEGTRGRPARHVSCNGNFFFFFKWQAPHRVPPSPPPQPSPD